MQKTRSFRHFGVKISHAQPIGGAAIRGSMTPGRVSDVVFLPAGRTACLSDTAKKNH